MWQFRSQWQHFVTLRVTGKEFNSVIKYCFIDKYWIISFVLEHGPFIRLSWIVVVSRIFMTYFLLLLCKWFECRLKYSKIRLMWSLYKTYFLIKLTLDFYVALFWNCACNISLQKVAENNNCDRAMWLLVYQLFFPYKAQKVNKL